MSQTLSPDDALSRAKIKVMRDPKFGFIATIVLSMRYVWDTSYPTAATDGFTIYINPDSYLKLTPGQQVSRLLHENWHVALKHLLRAKFFKNKEKYNIACDYYINNMLIEQGCELIPTWYRDEKFLGMSADEIYEALPDDLPGIDSFSMDLLEPPEDGHANPSMGMDSQMVSQHIDNLLIRAAIQAQAQGKGDSIPSDIQAYLDSLSQPRLPWFRILRKYCTALNGKRYSYLRPNRRYRHLGKVMPSQYSQAITDVALFTDVSGSVTDHQFHHFLSETFHIIRSIKPKTATFVQFDHRLVSEDRIRSVRDLSEVKFRGRGGTNIRPVLEWLAENRPSVAIIFTDGEFNHYPELDPKLPIFWIIHSNPDFKPPFGKVIEYSFQE